MHCRTLQLETSRVADCRVVQGHITSVLGFLEASHTVEILRDAGPQGLHAKDIARQIEEIHLGKDAPTRDDIDHLDPAHLSTLPSAPDRLL